MKLNLLATAMILAVAPDVFPGSSHAQEPVSAIAGAVSLGSVIDQAKSAIDEIIAQAFDRLDQSVLLAAMEARATINAAATQYDEARSRSLDDLDAQQRRIASDLQRFSASTASNLEGVIGELRAGASEALSNVRLLLSNQPGAAFVTARLSLR